jgi:hypothetical protein
MEERKKSVGRDINQTKECVIIEINSCEDTINSRQERRSAFNTESYKLKGKMY